MKRLITIGLMSVVLASAYSSVYACDHSAKASTASKEIKESKESRVTASTNGKTIRTLVVGATTGCRTVDSIVSFDIDVPGRTNPKFVHIEALQTERPAPSAFKTAVTLGRALVTTVEAVIATLLDAASEKTASLV
jgi:hypothetical protein